MKFPIRDFFAATPAVIDNGLTIVITSLSIGVSIAVAKSDFLSIGGHGLKAHNQAVINQEALRQSIYLNQSQQLEFDRLKRDVEEIATQNPSIVPLVREFEASKERFSTDALTDLIDTVEESEEILGLKDEPDPK